MTGSQSYFFDLPSELEEHRRERQERIDSARLNDSLTPKVHDARKPAAVDRTQNKRYKKAKQVVSSGLGIPSGFPVGIPSGNSQSTGKSTSQRKRSLTTVCDDDEDLGPSQESKAQSTRAWDSDQEDEGDRLEREGGIPIPGVQGGHICGTSVLVG